MAMTWRVAHSLPANPNSVIHPSGFVASAPMNYLGQMYKMQAEGQLHISSNQFTKPTKTRNFRLRIEHFSHNRPIAIPPS
jgi:hypothetical protein